MQHRDRKSIRLKNYDYTQSAVYFVTICTHKRTETFGRVESDKVNLSEVGKIVEEEWLVTEAVRKRVILDEFIVMPNHIHGILAILDDITATSRRVADLPPMERATGKVTLKSASLGAIAGQFKSKCTKRIRKLLKKPDFDVWQRNYHDHIVRDDRELETIREYIRMNPITWHYDRHNGEALAPDSCDRLVRLRRRILDQL